MEGLFRSILAPSRPLYTFPTSHIPRPCSRPFSFFSSSPSSDNNRDICLARARFVDSTSTYVSRILTSEFTTLLQITPDRV